MQEITFMKGLVKEIKRHNDPRFRAINEWCFKIAQELESCDNITEKQELHAAVITWNILIVIYNLEESFVDESTEITPVFTICNENDLVAQKHRIQIDFDKKIIVISAESIDVGNIILTESKSVNATKIFEPLTVALIKKC